MPRNARQIAQQLVELQTSIEPALGKIDSLKEALREIAEQEGQGFTEQVEGGTVEVKAGRDRQFKGLVPTLVAATWLSLSTKRQDALMQSKLVVLDETWTPASRPSVTIRV
jgi:hypothetical protein